jgi:hypothetical protein
VAAPKVRKIALGRLAVCGADRIGDRCATNRRICPTFAAIRSYEAIRSSTFLYVEYVNSEKEYHDLASDPDSAQYLRIAHPERKASLQATIAAAKLPRRPNLSRRRRRPHRCTPMTAAPLHADDRRS